MENEPMEMELEEDEVLSPVQSEIERGQMIDDSEMNEFDQQIYNEAGVDHEEMDEPGDEQKSPGTIIGKGKKSPHQKDCVEIKREMIKVHLPEKPCVLTKSETIPREQLSKQKYLDFLSTPSKKCPPICEKKEVMRRALPLSSRVNHLALPSKRKLLATLADSKDILPQEMIDNLIKMIEMETCLTPEQTEKIVRTRKQRSERKSTKSKTKYQAKVKKKSSANRMFDEEAANYQYLLAQRFVKNMLDWKCNFPYEDYQDLSKVVFKRICNQINYVPTVYEDRKSEQIRFLADIVAGWILGIVAEVAEEQKEQLRKDMASEDVRDKKKDELEKVEELSKEESLSSEASTESDEKKNQDSHQDDEKEEKRKKKEGDDEAKKRAQEEKEAKKQAKEEEKRAKKEKKEEEKAEKKRKKEEEKEAKKKQKEEEKEAKKKQKEEEKARKEQEEKERLKKAQQEKEVAEVKQDQGTQEPEPTQVQPKKLVHPEEVDTTSYESLAEVVELAKHVLKGVSQDSCDQTVKQVQEALYCEIVSIINNGVSRGLMSNRKEMFEVCGKIACWINKVLNECGVNPAVLDGSSGVQDEDRKWLLDVALTLSDWFGWLRCKIGHYKEMASCKFSEKEWDEWLTDFCENYKRFSQMQLEFMQEVKCANLM